MKTFCLYIATLLILVATGRTGASVSITYTGTGVLIVLENQIINNARQITLQTQGQAAIFVHIRATAGIEPIRYIRVASTAWGTVDNQTIIDVTENGGTIPWIHTIERISAFPNNDSELAEVRVGRQHHRRGVVHLHSARKLSARG